MNCAICRASNADRHHIVSRGSGGGDEEWNLIYLCRIHHVEFHTVGWFVFSRKHPVVAERIKNARWLAGKPTESRVGRC